MEYNLSNQDQNTEQNKQNLEYIQPVDPNEVKRLRHKAEKPLYIILALINAAIVIGVLFGGLDLLFFDSELDNDFLLVLIIIAPFIILYSLYFYYAITKSHSIRVTEVNFPEIYYKSVEFAERLQLKKVPAVYITQENGILNAFAAAVLGKRYAQLNSELVDVAYMENRDFNTVYFVLAHEFAHIYFKHVTFLYHLFIYIVEFIPFIGSPLSRAREYSCDRIAQLLQGSDGVEEMMVFYAGRHLYKYVDANNYLETARKERGFSLWLVNAITTHPILMKRIAALADPEKRSGKLF